MSTQNVVSEPNNTEAAVRAFGPDDPLQLTSGIQLRFFEVTENEIDEGDDGLIATLNDSIRVVLTMRSIEEVAERVKAIAAEEMRRAATPINVLFVVIFYQDRFGLWCQTKSLAEVAAELVVGIVTDYQEQREAGTFDPADL